MLLENYIDHTLLKPDATPQNIIQLLFASMDLLCNWLKENL
jgi:deoxyribose-phosphate aldolase